MFIETIKNNGKPYLRLVHAIRKPNKNGHVACKVGSRDTYAHTSLDQGVSRLMFSYL